MSLKRQNGFAGGSGKAGGGMRVDYTLVPFSMILIKSTNANIW